MSQLVTTPRQHPATKSQSWILFYFGTAVLQRLDGKARQRRSIYNSEYDGDFELHKAGYEAQVLHIPCRALTVAFGNNAMNHLEHWSGRGAWLVADEWN